MSNATAAAPERATKAPDKAKGTPSPTVTTKAASPVPPANLTADELLVVSTLRQQVWAVLDAFQNELHSDSLALLGATSEELEKMPSGAYVAMYLGAAQIAGAIAIERLANPASTGIAHMEAIRQSLETASIDYNLTMEPGEAMAEGIRAGQRQYRDRPAPPIRRMEEEAEIKGPNALTRKQLLCVLEVAAGNLATIDNILMQAQTEPDSWALSGLVDAAQALTRHCGGMVDAAAGAAILGGHDRWNFGPNFADLGKVGAA